MLGYHNWFNWCLVKLLINNFKLRWIPARGIGTVAESTRAPGATAAADYVCPLHRDYRIALRQDTQLIFENLLWVWRQMHMAHLDAREGLLHLRDALHSIAGVCVRWIMDASAGKPPMVGEILHLECPVFASMSRMRCAHGRPIVRVNALRLERGVLVRARRNGHGHVPLRRKPKVAEKLGHELHGQRAFNASTFGHALIFPLRRDVLESMT
ncbi:hypothetical protein PsorP6_004925 [Peronosclerospora sorghi]|uniref:Uncharacterized protein n=1 Tax=Peronosclerospora sorghi TaxID=230839 RepID=A0ACC0W8V1_9STRA|nr:hypothetical protein PsorP6_004925 [Peronosclerospora sorghi]